jgi:ribonuclease J
MKRMKDTTDELLGGNTAAPKKKTGPARSTKTRPANKQRRYKAKNSPNKTQTQTNQRSTRPQNTRNKRNVRSTLNSVNRQTNNTVAPKGKLRVIPLGGCEEVGRNMTVFEYENDIVILDMGIQFPEEDMPGIDYIIPNISYLKGKEKNIKAVIFSHGHLDHIGAAPILLEKLGYPLVIGRPLTLSMIKHKMDDYKKGGAAKLKSITIKTLKDKIKLGKFTSTFFQMEHSIMDAVGVILETPINTLIHPGDWTLERDKNNKPILDYSHLAKLKRPTTLMLESLGAIDVRPSSSNDVMKENLKKLITDASGRIIIGTFSSQIERVGWIIEQAEKLGKKVALDGYSMKMNVEIAKEHGYIKAKPHTLIKVDQIHNHPDNKLIIIATGAQGEGNAVLSRIIAGDHRHIQLKKADHLFCRIR